MSILSQKMAFQIFLSTPSARRATRLQYTPTMQFRNFYPRPPRGERRRGNPQIKDGGYISIHALREESDAVHPQQPLWVRISIHALREESDSKNGEKHLRFCFIIKRFAQIWKSLSKNIQKNSCDLHRTA